jgi:hypothetical protein
LKQVLAVLMAVMLFLGSLIPRMSMEQATRLPELLTHYQQHQREEGRDLSFWAFLIEHYALDSHHTKAPNHSHNRLPSFDGGSPAYDFTQALRLASCMPLVLELRSLAVFRLHAMNARQGFAPLLQPPRC